MKFCVQGVARIFEFPFFIFAKITVAYSFVLNFSVSLDIKIDFVSSLQHFL